MRQFAHGDAIPQDARGAAIALGNFDGVHIGHQAVLRAARNAARERGAAFGAGVFEPHPRRYFSPDTPPFRLQTPRQRARALAALGVASIFEIGFDPALAQSSDEHFVRAILRERLGVVQISVGADFRFGRHRMGDIARLAELGAEMGFGVESVAPVVADGATVSSSAIRQLLRAGELARANALLTRPWAIEGKVQNGRARGRDFGFPTANVALGDYLRPRLGVYAVRARIGDETRDGVASIGVNPSVGALPEPLLEAHLFDFDADLYGKEIEVEFIAFLRDEAQFEDIEALKLQMARDAEAARQALAG